MFSNYNVQKPVVDKLINQQIEEGIQFFDDVNFNYAVLNKNNPTDFFITSNIPEWYDSYKEQKRQLTDPVVLRALTREDDFYWDQRTMSATWGDDRIFNDAKEFDIISGHTFVVHDQLNNIGMLNIIQKTGSLSSFKRCVNANSKLLISLLRRCHVMNLKLQGVTEDVFSGDCHHKANDGGEWYDLFRRTDGVVVESFRHEDDTQVVLYRKGQNISARPARKGEVMGDLALFTQLLIKAGYE